MQELQILREALASARRRDMMDEYTIILAGIVRLYALQSVIETDTAEIGVVTCAA